MLHNFKLAGEFEIQRQFRASFWSLPEGNIDTDAGATIQGYSLQVFRENPKQLEQS
jgi:hypothetical protein